MFAFFMCIFRPNYCYLDVNKDVRIFIVLVFLYPNSNEHIRRPSRCMGDNNISCSAGLTYLYFDNTELLHVFSGSSGIFNYFKAVVLHLFCHDRLQTNIKH